MPLEDLPGNDRAALDAFCQRLRRELGPHVVSVRLFGSKSRGDWTEESDVDLAVVVDDRPSVRRREVSDWAYDAGVPRGVLLSVKVFDRAGYDRMLKSGQPFAQAIEKEGIELWTRQ